MSVITDIRELVSKFHKTAGHMHTGAEGDAPIIPVGGALVAIYEDSTDKGDVNTLKFTTGLDVTVAGNTATIAVDKTELSLTQNDIANLTTSSSPSFTGVTASSMTDSGLTATRVIYAGIGGLLSDSADLIFDGASLNTHALTVHSFTTAGILHNAVTTGVISSSLIVAADIDSSITPTFAGLTLTGFSGILVGTAGIVSTTPDNHANWDSAYSASHTHANIANLNVINQDLNTASNVAFNNMNLTAMLGIIEGGETPSAYTRFQGVAQSHVDFTYSLPGTMASTPYQWLKCTDLGVWSWATMTQADITNLKVADSPTFAGIYIKDGATTLGVIERVPAQNAIGIQCQAYGRISFGASAGWINTNGDAVMDGTGTWKLNGTLNLVPLGTGIAHITGGAGEGVITSSLIVNADVHATAGIEHSKLQTMITNTVLGNSTAGTTTPSAMNMATLKTILAYAPADITFAATSRVLGRISAGGGAGEELTGANIATILGSPTFTGPTVNGAGLFSHSSYQTITTTAASTGARLLYLKQKSDADYGMQFNVDNQSTGDFWLQRVEAGSDAEIWCVFRPTGIVDFNYAISSAGLTVNANKINISTAKTPSSSGDTGIVGDICWDASYIYVCTATNFWERAAIAAW